MIPALYTSFPMHLGSLLENLHRRLIFFHVWRVPAIMKQPETKYFYRNANNSGNNINMSG